MDKYSIKLHDNEVPVIKLIYETFQKTTKDDLELNYFNKWGHANKWACFSDYSLEGKKPNDVITFSFFPHIVDMVMLSDLIKGLAPTEIKKASKINPDFISFIRDSPFLNFSIILSNHQYVFNDNRDQLKASMLFSIDQMLGNIPKWEKQNPHMSATHGIYITRLKEMRQLVERDKKIQLLKNMFLITSIGSILSTLICNRTNTEVFGWFSDRDGINDISKNFSINLFNSQFIQYLKNQDCKFLAAPASSADNEWYSEIIKNSGFYYRRFG